MSIYNDEGFKNRREYLENLAEETGCSKEKVFMLAQMLGSSEDFDGLVTACQDEGNTDE